MKKNFLILTLAFLGCSFGAIAQTIYSQNFSTAVFPAMPTGWTNTVTGGAAGWQTTNASVSMALSTLLATTSDPTFAYINDYSATSGTYNAPAYMTSPVMSLSGAANPWLQFDAFFDSSYDYRGTATDTFEYAYVQASTTGTTWTTIANVRSQSAWYTQYVNLSAYVGATTFYIRFAYTDNRCPNNGIGVTNIRVFNLDANDIALTAVSPAAGDMSNDYIVYPGTTTLKGVMQNLSPATISTFSATYQVGAGTPVTTTFTGLSIPSLGTYSFTCSTPYSLTGLGVANYKMWVTETGDPVLTNDTLSNSFTGVSTFPAKRIFFEAATGTWCGYCVRDIVYMDSLWSIHSGNVSIVNVHDYNSYDPMAHENTQTTDYDNWLTTFPGFTGFPTIVVDRAYVDDPSNCFTYYNNMSTWFGYANMNLNTSVSGSTLTASVIVTPAINMSGSYQLEFVVEENNVYHTTGGLTGGWSQHNYYAVDVNNMPLSGAGYNFQDSSSGGAVSTDPPMYLHYDFVDRYTLPTLSSTTCNGIAGSLPSTMTAGTAYNYTAAAITIPTDWVSSNLCVIALLIDNNATSPTYGHVLNSVYVGTVSTTVSASASPATICIGGTSTLTASGSSSSYSWSPARGLSATTGAVVMASPTVTTTYSVTGSAGTAVVTVTVNPLPHVAAITGATTVCSGASITLADSTTGGIWSSSAITVGTVSSSGVLTGVSAGTTIISYVVSSSCGSAIATRTVTVYATPATTVTPGMGICVGSSATLTATGATTYSWSPGTGLSVTTGATVIATPSATITYTVTGSNAGGCTHAAVTTVTVSAIPTISAGGAASIYLGYSATLTATGGTTYSWTPPATLSVSTGATVIASPTITTTYTVTGTTAGCSNHAVETVTVTLRPCATPTTTPTTGITPTAAILNWSAVTGATEYLVSYKTSAGSTWTNLLSTSTSQALSGLTSGTAYNYKVRTICGALDSSGTSSVGTFTTMVVCGTPTSISSTGVATTTATINWSAVTGATNYILAYKVASASTWSTLLVTGTTRTLTGLSAATIYEYELRSVCGAGDSSGYTAYSTFTTLGGLPACPTPTGLTSVIGGSIVTLSWTAVPGAIAYQINYQLVTHGTPTYAYTTTNAIAISGLTLSSTYEYKVRTICAAGDTSAASPYTTFRVVTDGITPTSTDPSIVGDVMIFPNPTQDKFTISYQLNEDAPVTIVISNTLGQTVAILNNNEMQDVGEHNISFAPVSSGLYIVRMMIGNEVYTEKVVRY